MDSLVGWRYLLLEFIIASIDMFPTSYELSQGHVPNGLASAKP